MSRYCLSDSKRRERRKKRKEERKEEEEEEELLNAFAVLVPADRGDIRSGCC